MKRGLAGSLVLLVLAACSDNPSPSAPSQQQQQTQYTLSLSASPAAGGSITASPSQAQFTSGTTVSLTAVAAQGYQFASWQGDVNGTTNPASLVMTANRSVTAVFTQPTGPYVLTVATSPSSCGSITRSPNLTQYPAGTTVTLTAPATCSAVPFKEWTGDVTGSANPVSFTMDRNKTVTAVYAAPGTTPQIQLSSASLGFSYSAGGATPAPQTVNITNGGGGSLAGLGASVSYAAGQTTGWLTASLGSATAPATLTATVASVPSALGTYNATISITSGSASNSPQTISVTLTVTMSGGLGGAPSVSAPSSAATGSPYTVTVTYTGWPQLGGTSDRLELEESTSPGSGFQLVSNSPLGSHPSSWAAPITRTTAATYYYRAKAVLSSGSSSSYSPVVSVVVSAPASLTVYASYDNTVVYSSLAPACENTVYPSTDLCVGSRYLLNLMYGFDSLFYASALKFNVQSQIAGRPIASATLRLYVNTLRGDFNITPTIRVNAWSADWNPAALTYNLASGLPTWPTGEAQELSPSNTILPVEFDVTTIVRNWASGAWSNYGLRVMVNPVYPGYTPSLGDTCFQSLEVYDSPTRRPQLIIEFR